MSESNQPPPSPERFWRPAPELPAQPEFQLPTTTPYPQPFTSPPFILPPTRDYAGWLQRVFATLVDFILSMPWTVVGISGATFVDSAENKTIPIVLMLIGFAGGATFTIWNSIVRQGLTGASLGKSYMGIRVIGEQSGHEIGIARNLARYLLHFLDSATFYLGYLWPIWDAKKQTFADKIMGTIVVSRRSR